jgi:hypothetical protein
MILAINKSRGMSRIYTTYGGNHKKGRTISDPGLKYRFYPRFDDLGWETEL